MQAKLGVEEQTYGSFFGQYQQARTDEALQANSVSVVEPAVVPVSPSKPNVRLYLALAILIGLLGGLGVALAFENLDRTLHSAAAVATSGVLLGQIPRATGVGRGVGLLFTNALNGTPACEAFRMLGVTMWTLSSSRG